jgi:hypothetical protein
MKRTILIALFFAAAFLAGERATAQVLGNAVGPKAGFYLDGGYLMVGAIADFALTANIDLEPGLEFVLGKKNTTRIVVDGNIRYSFPLQGLTVKPFVLGGLGLQYDSFKSSSGGNATGSQTKLLANLGGGAVFSTRSRIQPWGALKFSFLGGTGDGGALLEAGVNFYL